MHTFHFLIKIADTNTTKPWYISTGLIDGVTWLLLVILWWVHWISKTCLYFMITNWYRNCAMTLYITNVLIESYLFLKPSIVTNHLPYKHTDWHLPLYPKEQQTTHTHSVVWKTTKTITKALHLLLSTLAFKWQNTCTGQLVVNTPTYTISTVKRWLGPDRSVALTRNVSSILPLSNLSDSSLLSSLQSHVLSSWWG